MTIVLPDKASAEHELQLPNLVPASAEDKQEGKDPEPNEKGKDCEAIAAQHGCTEHSVHKLQARRPSIDSTNSLQSVEAAVLKKFSTASVTLKQAATLECIGDTITKMDSHRCEKEVSRNQILSGLLGHGTCPSADIHPCVGLRGLLGIVLGMVVVIAGFASWPMEDPFDHPHKWWECMLQCATIWTFTTAAFLVVTTFAVMSGETAFPMKAYFTIVCVGATAIIGWWLLVYAIWVLALGLPYPAPWHGGSSGIFAFFCMLSSVWWAFPGEWRADPLFRKRMLWIILSYFAFLILMSFYWMLMFAFFMVPDDWQWLLALVVPLVREFGGIAVAKLACWAAGSTDMSIILTMQNMVLTNHAIFLALCLGSCATLLSAVILLSVDFLNNLYLGTKVVRFIGSTEESKRVLCAQSLLMMVLSETLEFFLPLAYLVCFLVAYHGPNAHVLGNVKNSRWQFQATEDIQGFVLSIIMLVSIDALSMLISGTLLWYKCGLNVWRVFLYLQKEYGYVMAVQQAWTLEQSFCVIAIGCALDLTFQFSWVHA